MFSLYTYAQKPRFSQGNGVGEATRKHLDRLGTPRTTA